MTNLNKHISAIIIALITLIPVQTLQAQTQQGAKLGFVDIDRLLREATPAKTAQAKLEREFSKREKEIDAIGAKLKTATEKFEKEAPNLAGAQLEARQRQLIEQDRDFQTQRLEFQQDLNSRKQEELQKIIDRANKIVRQVAQEENYDWIFQEAVYINPKFDITDKVLKSLNSGK